jgi:hypothetical protein
VNQSNPFNEAQPCNTININLCDGAGQGCMGGGGGSENEI